MGNQRTIYVPDDIWRQLKSALALEDRSISEWVRDSAIDYLNGGIDSRRSSRRRENYKEGDGEMMKIDNTT